MSLTILLLSLSLPLHTNPLSISTSFKPPHFNNAERSFGGHFENIKREAFSITASFDEQELVDRQPIINTASSSIQHQEILLVIRPYLPSSKWLGV
ncbi:Hypothetical protein FKW44_003572 [Caligus rogercresseyi]|uniref:Uncharacterized protein n=1 Tax=Caligus rogercresseyi TaxID=217165 RepID=A0A7T8KLW8_CALRO|nr:Hypothetical protein FKW44_003572 [Caligus rogercresseyi]